MHRFLSHTTQALLLALCAGWSSAQLVAEETVRGTQLDPAGYGVSYIESLQDAIDRNLLTRLPEGPPDYQERHGIWVVPSRRATTAPHSGDHHVVNKWGDTRMGIGFPGKVHLHGAYFAGQADEGVWTTGIQVIGYCDGQTVARTEWFRQIGSEPRWFEMNLAAVDRIEIICEEVFGGAGWYAMDDLTYTPTSVTPETVSSRVVVDFDDLSYRTQLTNTNYAGLTWETGSGKFTVPDVVHGPLAPPGIKLNKEDQEQPRDYTPGRGTAPTLLASYQGVIRGDAGSMSYPPDTDGAIGPNHYVETVNRNFAVYDKTTGAELTNILLGAFLPGSNGDPRTVFNHHSGRWIVTVPDFSATATIFMAVSLTDDPTGDWFKTSFHTAEGSDAGNWPDYPTLGVDANGIYIAAYMVGGGGMTIWAIDKAPLVAPSPSLGTITAFRNLPWEGAIQPAHTYGYPGGFPGCEYLVSIDASSSDRLRVRRVNPPLTAPTLTNLGTITVGTISDPPNAPALGSSTPLNTVDSRLMMSVYRDGSLWTCHTISYGGKAAVRWYEIDPSGMSLLQIGTVADSTLYYFFPSIMVNQSGNVVMGFTGSHSSQYAACYYTGRMSSDPLGEMAEPIMFKEGTGPQNNVDGYGRNRWGDYSYTTLDPLDQTTFWTIQEYGHSTDIWGTYIATLTMGDADCNENGIADQCDIDCGPVGGDCDVPDCGDSQDCNNNGVPDECELANNDCNNNSIPDDCDLAGGFSQDCNENGIPDECDISAGSSEDCQPNGVPDECEIGATAVSISFPLDSNPGWSTEDQWAFGQPTGGGGEYGGPDPTSGHTGSYVYGYNLNGDYPNNLPERHLTSTAIDCTGWEDTQLTFWRWLGVEQPIYDHAYVRVSNNGTNWVTIWSNPTEVSDSTWSQQTYDISAVADDQSTVYLRWTMGTTDGGWRYCGWNIDDIELTGNISAGGEGDCNANGIPDECDIAAGTSNDDNGNGIPDECEGLGDMNCDGSVNAYDIDGFICALSPSCDYEGMYPNCYRQYADINGDGEVNSYDIDGFIALVGGG
ncbi:MAG: dockerin type I domain-containing protein [Planctomycetota bacterium]